MFYRPNHLLQAIIWLNLVIINFSQMAYAKNESQYQTCYDIFRYHSKDNSIHHQVEQLLIAKHYTNQRKSFSWGPLTARSSNLYYIKFSFIDNENHRFYATALLTDLSLHGSYKKNKISNEIEALSCFLKTSNIQILQNNNLLNEIKKPISIKIEFIADQINIFQDSRNSDLNDY